MNLEEKALEARARRLAKKHGYVARKSRKNLGTSDNRGQFMLIEPRSNTIVGGERFDVAALQVIEFLRSA